ncbi:hypothetical protein GXB85_05655 [Cellulomonas sp. APG4]|uniref:hypothetical protein n=1 Tax=Cellulomonas sp. APG4 TaxID=1538656 RepID=UPI00137B8563|nr:hypothetical protein [Cellulomonas sp. APG4]NCT90434.1 hypothetical protein [Cellulomonas sp. APG4]
MSRRSRGREPAGHPGPTGAARALLVAVGGSVALTAIGGGAALAAGLEDEHLGLELLSRTPFDSYLWPGIALAAVVGGSASVATVLAARGDARAGAASLGAGCVLAGWIGAEVALLDQPEAPTATEVVYLAAAAVMVGLGGYVSRRAREAGATARSGTSGPRRPPRSRRRPR